MKAEELTYIREYFKNVSMAILDAMNEIREFNYGNALKLLNNAMPPLKTAPDPIFEVGDIIRHKDIDNTTFNYEIKDIHDYEYWFSECNGLPFEYQNMYVVVRKKNKPLKWKKAPLGDSVSMGTNLRYDDNNYYLDVDGYTLSVNELVNKLPKEE